MSSSVGDLAVRVPVLSLDDSIAKAAEALRAAPTRAVPVAQNGRLIGVLHPIDLAEVLDGAADVVARMPIAAVQPGPCLVLTESTPADQALAEFRRQHVDAAPVVDGSGRYVGMVGTAELISAACGRIRPPTIGGLATPFGVYLTTGVVRAGVGDLALVSTGVYTGLLFTLAFMLASLIVAPGGWLDQWPAVRSLLPTGLSIGALLNLVALVIFAVVFRLSWVAGYHAAEHQVVHAIEQGEELLPEAVRSKPRVHPRCGTNLVVGLMLLLQVMKLSGRGNLVWGELTLVLGLILVLFVYRRLGAVAQQYITTRPATSEQIENGIRAGKQLLARHQRALGENAGPWQRVWNMGLAQVFVGLMLVLLALHFLEKWVPMPFALG